ncbi:MAG: hypothetical protein HC904_13070 [Blastochloris sp.]|nr:hypothetical protein [Blastochloris sp.]
MASWLSPDRRECCGNNFMGSKVYLAVDLGASSGRVLAGVLKGERLELRELHRFPCEAVEESGGWRWKVEALLEQITVGLERAVGEYGAEIVSLGVDTWGVDYVLLDEQGERLGRPYQYRDKRTEGMMEKALGLMPKEEIYGRTGIQFMFFNTLFQLLADKSLGQAARLLFMPDLVNHYLTGVQANEHSIASTSQLLDARTQDWDGELMDKMGIPRRLFGPLVKAGTVLGPLRKELQERLGSRRIRWWGGSHDTASAVAGIPSLEEEPVF